MDYLVVHLHIPRHDLASESDIFIRASLIDEKGASVAEASARGKRIGGRAMVAWRRMGYANALAVWADRARVRCGKRRCGEQCAISLDTHESASTHTSTRYPPTVCAKCRSRSSLATRTTASSASSSRTS